MPWLLCAFVGSLPLELALRVWDAAIVAGTEALPRVAAAIIASRAPAAAAAGETARAPNAAARVFRFFLLLTTTCII